MAGAISFISARKRPQAALPVIAVRISEGSFT